MEKEHDSVTVSDDQDHMRLIVFMAGIIFQASVDHNPRKYRMTLGELQIVNAIYMAHIEGRAIVVADLVDSLDMPRSTVSKQISRLWNAGWLSEAVDPDDRRRRLLMPTDSLVAASQRWRQQIEAGRQRAARMRLPITEFKKKNL